eukprot:4828535-Amphidinium_carterae.1
MMYTFVNFGDLDAGYVLKTPSPMKPWLEDVEGFSITLEEHTLDSIGHSAPPIGRAVGGDVHIDAGVVVQHTGGVYGSKGIAQFGSGQCFCNTGLGPIVTVTQNN